MNRRELGAVCLALLGSQALASDWPVKPVRLIVPFGAGGATDLPARLLGERLGKMWKQQVVIENRPGAGGSLGAAEAARATDGHTLFFPSGTVLTANQYVYPKLAYDPVNDFSPVTIVVGAPQVLVVPAESSATTTEALIKLLHQSPGKLAFGHAGIGSQSHLGNEYFLQQAKAEATGVPYRSDPQAITDMLGGKLDFAVLNMAAVVPHVRSGKLRALGVSSTSEVPHLPGVAPLGRVLPGFENASWFGLVAPSSMPSANVERVYRDVRTVLLEPEVRERLEGMGFRVVASTPADMANTMSLERKRWATLVEARKIRVE